METVNEEDQRRNEQELEQERELVRLLCDPFLTYDEAVAEIGVRLDVVKGRGNRTPHPVRHYCVTPINE